ncbi:flavin monoamine oxidase family protein [Streptomyces sp. NPDC018947]|uniref:flavin monoamine oxidase family protein n=1 Tax=Streptomyces sp. NPDC018947 TaxID=3365054 RepID=UPI0037894609
MTDTIVVGAGIAGITAARLLRAAGHRVVVLEARDRVGGRIWTDRTAGFCVDRGASWIHGLTGNPLTTLVSALGMETREFTVGSFQAGGRSPTTTHRGACWTTKRHGGGPPTSARRTTSSGPPSRRRATTRVTPPRPSAPLPRPVGSPNAPLASGSSTGIARRSSAERRSSGSPPTPSTRTPSKATK